MSKVLVTGNLGYIGNILTPELQKKNYEVIGYDIDFYKDTEIYPINKPNTQIIKDVRDVELEDLKEIDFIVHLAALSNDPLGELNPNLTEDINYKATIKLANLAKQAGIKRFIYASSQSMYGISNTDNELDEDNSDKNPVTSYARTKWEAECELKKLADDSFIVVCFRPSTVFGASPRLRTDIIFNNFVANVYTTKKIEIKSDGTPWRPVVHIKDVSNAFIAGIEAPANIVNTRSFNVGIENGNFSVRDLAEVAQSIFKDSSLVFTYEHTDSRTYKVCFNRILSELKDFYKPEWDLKKGADELTSIFDKTGFSKEDFSGEKTNRILKLKNLIEKNILDNNLRFI
ncbi:MAG: SDR family oxidoreductase [Candidatus Sericytochromatia bacterium]